MDPYIFESFVYFRSNSISLSFLLYRCFILSTIFYRNILDIQNLYCVVFIFIIIFPNFYFTFLIDSSYPFSYLHLSI